MMGENSESHPIDPDIESQYNARAAIPGHVDILDRWARRSAAFRAQHAEHLDLAYGAGEREKIDLFLSGEPDAPLLIYFHGGYWQHGHKNEHSIVAQPLIQRGIHVAMVGYDLCPAVPLASIVAQARSAVAWVSRHALEYGLRRNACWVGGHSAGAHLATMVLAAAGATTKDEISGPALCGAIAISGVYDLAPLCRTSLNSTLQLDPEGARDLSPIHLAQPPAGPVLIAVGGGESQAFVEQAQALAKAWPGASAPLEVDRANHFTVLDALQDPSSTLLGHLIRLLRPGSAVLRG